jgi:hypothetical protein
MRRLLDRFVALLDFRGPLTRADRPLWESTPTLPDLAELTAQVVGGPHRLPARLLRARDDPARVRSLQGLELSDAGVCLSCFLAWSR